MRLAWIVYKDSECPDDCEIVFSGAQGLWVESNTYCIQGAYYMSLYVPDKWVILEITPDNGQPIYKILAGFYGGFTGSNSWKLSSGISGAETDERYGVVRYPQCSGSVYMCYPNNYGLSSLTGSMLSYWTKEVGATVIVMDKGFEVPTELYCE